MSALHEQSPVSKHGNSTEPLAVQAGRDERRAAAYVSSRRLANGLLVGMAGLVGMATALPAWRIVEDNALWQILRAGGRAGVVGGLADWFAVTALFRHPLGLPIPHTAILPRQKDRLGDALGRFISTQFFTDHEIERAIDRIDLPQWLARTLRDPANTAALGRTIRQMMPPIISVLEDGKASLAIERALPVLLQGEDTARLVARSLRALVDTELHQEVLTVLLESLKSGLHEKEPALRQFIEARVREQGGRMVSWAIGGSVASRVLDAINTELSRVDPSDSVVREGFTRWARKAIDRVERDPEHRGNLVEAFTNVLQHESLRAWSGELWARLRDMLLKDLARGDGWSETVIAVSIARLADEIADDTALRHKIVRGANVCVRKMLPMAREKLSHYISSVTRGWDEREFSERLEQRVGPDLQYIRVNGTLVGFLAGAALEVLSRGFFGVMP